jgi:hypothetical protein
LYASGGSGEIHSRGERVTDRSGSGLALLDSLMYSDKSPLHLYLALRWGDLNFDCTVKRIRD